jgi:hypothetical protein
VKKTEIRIQTYEVLVIRQKDNAQGESPGFTHEIGPCPVWNGPASGEPSALETIPDLDPPGRVEQRPPPLRSWIDWLRRKRRP